MRRLISLVLVLAVVFSHSATAFAASNSPYVEGNPEKIVITFNQLNGSTYQVTIRNDRDAAIGNWKLSFKTNFKLSSPEGVDWSVSKNNTYSFWDAAGESIASGDSFSFTVVSNKKKNSEIHNVSFEYEETDEFEGVDEFDPYDMLSKDADNDGLFDAFEEYLGTDPQKVDTDGDGLSDYDEVYVTLTAPDKMDSTGRGISDAEADFDKDGLTNLEEVVYGTDPFEEDTDKDALLDSEEIALGTDPLNSDTDGDGMIDGTESSYGMIPTNPDTLNDGILDGDRSFDVVLENSDAYDEYGLLTSVKISLLGDQIHTLNIKKIDATDVFLSDDMPGFIGNAFDYSVDGDFESAEISFTFPEELFSDPEFDPVIYYFNEDEQELEELPTEIVGNTATATVEHFSKYVLLNKRAYGAAFEWIENYVELPVEMYMDSDGDGITDYYEDRITLFNGEVIILDKNNPDTDGDGLLDGEEIEFKLKYKPGGGMFRVTARMWSDPTKVDTDGDGIKDLEDERPLYEFRYQYLGSPEHLKFVAERMADIRDDTTTMQRGRLGTEMLMKDYDKFLEYKGVDPTGKYREEYWKSEWDKYWDAYCNMINGYVDMRGSVDMDLHYFRNNLNRFPKTLDDMIKEADGWTLIPVSESIYHMNITRFSGNGLYNLKFVSNDGKYEAVYVNNYGNPYGNKPEPHYNGSAATEKNDPTNMGTYNYCGKYSQGLPQHVTFGLQHMTYDVQPYNKWGNTPPSDDEKPSEDNKIRFGKSRAAIAARLEFEEEWKNAGRELK